QMDGRGIRLEICGDVIPRRVGVLVPRKVHPGKPAVLRRGEQRERVPSGSPYVADVWPAVQDHESKTKLTEVVPEGQPGLASADDHDVNRSLELSSHDATCLARPPEVSADPEAGSRRATLKLNIIPLWMCSAMWQCAIHSPGLDTSSRMSTVCPDRNSTVSFHTRLGSGKPSLDRMRKRPAP